MALHTIQIVVVNGGKEGSYAANNATRKSSNTEEENGENFKESGLYKVLNAKKTITKKIQSKMSPQGFFAVSQAINIGAQVLKAAHNYRVSDIGRKHGDSNYQAIVNRQYEVGGEILSLLGGAFSGATAGAMTGNPIGIVVGAVAGLASAAINLGFKYAEKERAYKQTMFEESTANTYAIERNCGEGFIRLR